MSLLTDNERVCFLPSREPRVPRADRGLVDSFLLRAFQLSYIRQVLPNHAPNSSRSGQGPYNLIKFDNAEGAKGSPYISLSGLADEQQWPELASGRSSPPLAFALARDSSRTSHQGRKDDDVDESAGARRKRTAGPGPLGYTQTIVGKGSGVGGAGMRVDGVRRSWKGKGKLLEGGDDELRARSVFSNPFRSSPPDFAPTDPQRRNAVIWVFPTQSRGASRQLSSRHQ